MIYQRRPHGLLVLAFVFACGGRSVSQSETDASTEATTSPTTSTSDESESGGDSACEEMRLLVEVADNSANGAPPYSGHWFGPYGDNPFPDQHGHFLSDEDGRIDTQMYEPGRYMLELNPAPWSLDELLVRTHDRFEALPCSTVDLGRRPVHRAEILASWVEGESLDIEISSDLTLVVPATGVVPFPSIHPYFGGTVVPEEQWPLHRLPPSEELLAVLALGNSSTQALDEPFLFYLGDFGEPAGTRLRLYRDDQLSWEHLYVGEWTVGESEAAVFESERLETLYVTRGR